MLAARLKELRAEKGINQVKLAEVMNVTQGTVGKWETGSRMPTSDKIRKLADYFGVTPDFLLLEEKTEDITLLARRITGLTLMKAERDKLMKQLDDTIDSYLKERQNVKNDQ